MRPALITTICCLMPLAAADKAQSASEWEKFADGSTGRITTFQGAGGVPIPAYIRKPAGKGPFPVVVMLHGNVASKEDTYALGWSAGHLADFLASRWAIYSIDFPENR